MLRAVLNRNVDVFQNIRRLLVVVNSPNINRTERRCRSPEANQAEIIEKFSFLDKALSLTRWLDRLGHSIRGHPELQVEKATENKILSKKDPASLDLLLRSNLVQQELSHMNINSLSSLHKTVQVKPEVMRMLGGYLEREEPRDVTE